MKETIKKECEKLYDQTVTEIQKMVKIPSVRDVENASSGAPFGPGIAAAVEGFIKLADEIGMRTYKDPEGYYAYAEIGPLDTPMIGIVGHLDVVPVGDEKQWTLATPFSGEIIDGKMIGRGTLDDKGPLVINMMAAKALLNAGIELKNRVRFIAGTAEETTWECINKYVELEELPSIAYSPDANFPVINSEKTIMQFDFIKKNDSLNFTLLSTGAYNSVADSCVYTGPDSEKIVTELDKLGYEYKHDGQTVTTIGKGAHSMQCYLGVNAITRMAEAMFNAGIHTLAIDYLVNNIAQTTSGELIVGEVKDEISGPLTLNVGNIFIEKGQEKIGFDTRIPVLADHIDIINQFEKSIIAAGGEYNPGKLQEKLYVPKESRLVSTLLSAYEDVTGEKNVEPLSTGGGTYSRSMENCVAYGMVFEGMLDNMHQPNECLELKYVPMALEIYANAIYRLQD